MREVEGHPKAIKDRNEKYIVSDNNIDIDTDSGRK
jgi:hypothetical protein